MTDQQSLFWSKILTLFFQVALVIVLFLADSSVLVYWIYSGMMIVWVLWIFLFYLACLVAVYFYRDYRSFQKNLNLMLPQNDDLLPHIEAVSDDEALKALIQYHNGGTYQDISQDFNCDINKAKRLVIKGIDILLKEHKEANRN